MDSDFILILEEHLADFLSSKVRARMLEGLKYYKMENVMSGYNAAFIPNLIDEKIQYIAGDPVTFEPESDQKGEGERFRQTLGKKIDKALADYIREVSIKGWAWWQIFIDMDKETQEPFFNYKLIPAEQVCPIWADDEETELEGLLRVYDLDYYSSGGKSIITKAEYYDKDGTHYFIKEGKTLILDAEAYLDLPDDVVAGHFTKNGEQMTFGMIPWVYIKNNYYGIPDHVYVQSLVDIYNEKAQQMSELLTETRNFITEVCNYGGSPKDDIKQMIKDGIIRTDTDGKVVFHTPQIDTQANTSLVEQIKMDILDFGRAIPGPERLGSAPNEMVVKSLYAKVDLKCDGVKTSLSLALDQLRLLLNVYLSNTGGAIFEYLKTVYNTSMLVNESSTIDDIIKSIPILSKETLISRHPYVENLEDELQKVQKDKEEEMAMFPDYPNLPQEEIDVEGEI